MTKHIYEVHKNCDIMYCHICDGGLAVCIVCGGAEGSLTTDCPGVKQTIQQSDLVYTDDLDYINGEWKELK